MLKKKLKKFFTLSRRTEGFTLVELIVVIAILGILAGVGTVGYSGYIKNANKNSDKVLVGNIIRAIETGTNAYMFTDDDSYDFGMAKVPVGFIVLTNTKTADVVESTGKVEYVEGACEFVTVPNVYTVTKQSFTISCEKKDTFLTWCSTTKTDEMATISGPDAVTYCKTHSTISIMENQTKTYSTEFSALSHSNHTYTPTTKSITGNIIEADASNKLYQKSAGDASLCELAYAQQYGVVTPGTVASTTSGPIVEALQAAFGDLSNLTLKYDGWNTDEGQGYATLYPAASGMMENVTDLADKLATVSTWSRGNYNAKTLLKLESTYEDSAELFSAVANEFAEIYGAEKAMDVDRVTEVDGKTAWLNHWDNAANATDGMASFGYTENGQTGREHIYAVRRIYNEAFAAYLQANGVTGTALTKIKEYAQAPDTGNSVLNGVLDGMGAKFPLVVNEHTMATVLEGESAETIKSCTDLYKKYVGSVASDENAMAIYDLMMHVSETGDIATSEDNGVYDPSKEDSENYMNYYMQYINELSAMYSQAQDMAGDGIIIVVYREGGIVKCEVSPSTANPRN